MANSLNIRKLEIEINNQDIFYLITNSENDLHPFASLFDNCRHLIPNFEVARLQKIRREQNSCAESMAKEARKTSLTLKIFATPPIFALEAYSKDQNNC